MANPQKEDGYTAIANEIMDALCRIRIPGEEMQVLNAILRKTYGWKKCEDTIALSQFVEMTGLSKPHIIHSITGLLLKKVIIVAEKGNDKAKVYKFNKDYDKWEPLPKKVTLPKKEIGVAEKGNTSLPKKVPTKENCTKETITKETPEARAPLPDPPNAPPEEKKKATKNEENKFVLPPWIPTDTWNAYIAVRAKKRAAQTPYALNLIIKELEKIKKAHGHEPIDVLDKSIKSGWVDMYALKDSNGIVETDPFKGCA